MYISDNANLPTLLKCLLFFLQETFTVRVRSATALTTSNLEASNGDIVSVQATPGAANSYDVAAKSRTNKGKMTLSTIAGAGVLANTITVNVDVTDAQVSSGFLCAFFAPAKYTRLGQVHSVLICISVFNAHPLNHALNADGLGSTFRVYLLQSDFIAVKCIGTLGLQIVWKYFVLNLCCNAV